MLESFQIVGTQVLSLFVIIAIGVLGAKVKFITKPGVASMTDIMLYLVTPCVIINSFQKEFNRELLIGFLIAFGSAVLSHIIGIILSRILIRNEEEAKKTVLRFGAIFGNCGFMSLPLLDALLGEEGVFYGAAYVAVFNILLWTYGLKLMGSKEAKLSAKKILLNPGIISVAIGLILFFTSTKLPIILGKPISFLAALNTPIPMLIIGFYVAQLKKNEILKVKQEYLVMAIKLIAQPILLFALLYLCSIRGNLLVACVLSASAPVAATCTMFSVKFDRDAKLAAEMMAVSTLVSIATLTLIVGFVQYIA